ncbi:MAG: HD domain-containing protein [Lachnospiraceae bacterium]|nr:HD domain-containing protein [Lachnospiraceae bacterium]
MGTIFAAALGGLLPGIMTAVATNVLCSFFNPFSIYYTLINLLIAIITSYFVRRKFYRRKKNILLYLLALGVIPGALGMIFQWVLLGGPQFPEIAALSGRPGQASFLFFINALLLNILLNIADKGFSAALAVLALHFIPEETKTGVRNSAWRQKPLSEEELKELNKRSRAGGRSLGKRLSGMVILSSVALAGAMAFISLHLYFDRLKEEYGDNARNAAQFAVSVVNADRINEYLKSGKAMKDYTDPEFIRTEELLRAYQSNLKGIEYIYVYQIREDGCHTVFNTDDAVWEKARVGELVPFDESFEEYIPGLLRGEEMDVLENDDTFGYFLTAYEPIYDSAGQCVAYAGADASFSYMEEYMRSFLFRVILIFSGFFILTLAYGIWMSGYFLIYPINSMVSCVEDFIAVEESQEKLDRGVRNLRKLNISTGDEVERLYQAICLMASETAERMRSIRYFADATAQMQNGLIITMADLVENRDSDTGAHVQKTAAYVKIILEGLKAKGYYAGKLTPKFMAEAVMSAPLHDVGKINIPDAVLNKPGKLNEKEFEIMKTHTTAGKEIIERAIDRVKGENYLKEARNMAAYHHERWDGKGYPEGLHGEVIPLSARVMAVADVFDALASPRVYKPAFSVEKAIQIIRDGAGTQFDPKCVEVFLENLPEVRQVLKKYQSY